MDSSRQCKGNPVLTHFRALQFSINAHEAESVEARMFAYSLRERFNAGQLALFLR